VVATVYGGDNFVNEEKGRALAAIADALKEYEPDVVVAGPAFNAGRYGLACAEVCRLAREGGIPAVTAMYPENPGILTYRLETLVVPTSESPAGMPAAQKALAGIALKLARKEELGPAEAEGYLPRGIRKMGYREAPAARRALSMLVQKMAGRPFKTELPLTMPEVVPPAPRIRDLSKTKLALVTSGGLVPKGNPDKLPGGPASVWFSYPIGGLPTMTADRWESVHVGFYTNIVNQNPNYVVPLNLVRELEDRGTIGEVYDRYRSTSGRGTPVGAAKRVGSEMAAELKANKVGACLLVAT
jgi:glycine reductase